MKIFVTFLVLAALICAGLVYQLLFRDGGQKSDSGGAAVTTVPLSPPPLELPLSGVGTLQSLLDRKVSLECQIMYDSPDYEADVEGTYFVNNNKVRGDFIIAAPELGEQVVSSVIMDETDIYYWSVIDGESFGFVSSRAGAQNSEAVKKSEPVAMDADVRYVCKPWTVIDGSIYVPPSGVNFQDFGTLMEAGMEYGTP